MSELKNFLKTIQSSNFLKVSKYYSQNKGN